MDYEIIFCKDGVLRLKYLRKPLIPMQSIQETDNLDDFSFIVYFWDYQCRFEEGLTIASFLSCIEPWTEFFSKLTNKNIKSYIDESKKPIPIESRDTLIDFITLSYHTHMTNEVKYDTSDIDIKNLKLWLTQKRTFELKDSWDINSMYTLNGYNKNEEEHYSLSGSQMNEIAHVPIFLESKHFITFHEYRAKEKLGEDYSTFSPGAVGVKKIKSTKYSNESTYMQAEKTHNLREVVTGFFHMMHYSTSSRDEFFNALSLDFKALECEHEIAKSIIAQETAKVIEADFSSEKPTNTTEDNKTEYKNNVVAIGVNNKKKDKKPKTLRLNNTSTLRAIHQDQESFIDRHIAAGSHKYSLKIGKVVEAQPPQLRIGAILIDEKKD